jgi:hypothetical protein
VLSGWPNRSRWLDEPMPGELLKAAVWGSIWMRQGGLGTLEQIHSPRVPSGVSPRLATNRTGARPARQSSLYATPMERSMILLPFRRSAGNLPKRVQQLRSPPQSGSLILKRRLARALSRAAVMSNPATPGFGKLIDTYACRASRPTETSRPHCPVMSLARGTARAWGFDRWA